MTIIASSKATAQVLAAAAASLRSAAGAADAAQASEADAHWQELQTLSNQWKAAETAVATARVEFACKLYAFMHGPCGAKSKGWTQQDVFTMLKLTRTTGRELLTLGGVNLHRAEKGQQPIAQADAALALVRNIKGDDGRNLQLVEALNSKTFAANNTRFEKNRTADRAKGLTSAEVARQTAAGEDLTKPEVIKPTDYAEKTMTAFMALRSVVLDASNESAITHLVTELDKFGWKLQKATLAKIEKDRAEVIAKVGEEA